MQTSGHEGVSLLINLSELAQMTVEASCTRLRQNNGRQARIPNRKIRSVVFIGDKKRWHTLGQAAFDLALQGIGVFFTDTRGYVQIRLEPSSQDVEPIWHWLEDRYDDAKIRHIYNTWYWQQASRLYHTQLPQAASLRQALLGLARTREQQYLPPNVIVRRKIKKACQQVMDMAISEAMQRVKMNVTNALIRDLKHEWQPLFYPYALEELAKHRLRPYFNVHTFAVLYGWLYSPLSTSIWGSVVKLKYALDNKL